MLKPPDEAVARESRDLTIAEIESRMARDGFPEMQWLWCRFASSGTDLSEIDAGAIAGSRKRHMGAMTSHPIAMLTVSLVVAIGFFFYLDHSVLPASPNGFDRFMQVLFSVLGVYFVWFLTTAVQRNWIHPWKTIASTDLAFMLRHRIYREWHRETIVAKQVVQRLAELGVNDQWDNPDYRAAYSSHGGTVKKVDAAPPAETVQKALREVLGQKVDRVFQPGRYFSNLQAGKKSVNRFLREHGEAIAQSRDGILPVEAGISLLTALQTELRPESAGHVYLAGVLHTLESPNLLGKGVVEAYVWARDPWVDLTHSQDFYSSASLPGNSLWDRIERRSKGMLGPFGYLRNKSISALDFRTSEGRCVRARLAAATSERQGGEAQTALFVDAVEGRFDIKPALIRRAIEDYARAAGFDLVIYHMFPLNRVPLRFVRHLAAAGLPVEERNIVYVHADCREYLDAFGLPVEPFEYARPRGKVIGYCVDLGDPAQASTETPGPVKLLYHRVKGKSILWGMLLSAFLSLAWVLYRLDPRWLVPGALLFAGAIAYEILIAPRIRRRRDREEPLP